ncbi:MAG: CpsD/CapB family tyrosine-protein kinase [Bryobacterales bacterium]|nr:CpsD/CapB family tyrosine-protein kinase [Bryobacterales bacterium]
MKKHVDSLFQSAGGGRTLSSDAVRLSTTLRAAIHDNDKLILICSAFGSEGVSTIAVQLGIAMAMMAREPVLLLETNLHDPTVHESFGVESKPGLPEFVIQGLTLDEVVRPTGFAGLSLLPGGTDFAPPAEEILLSPRFAELMAALRRRYRFVIIDSPPMFEYADTAIIAQQADGAVVVIAEGARREPEVKELIRMLRSLNTKVFGAVLSQR